ncbi:MAG TPA: flagellar basal body-associated FliL family protein [Sedimentisphaerales bacterium]|jgi:flagellar basal body-associated protein FliL|nr:flagellar basal body-associated FliL family protein [Sedimentisphaerales bacterium]HNU27779.1 flagellar basal body-associated FliL family protein [Sedimentisphaerales bacterium]
MAESEKVEKGRDAGPALPPNKSMMAKAMPMAVIGAAVIVFAGGGFVVGRLFGTRGQARTASADQASSDELRLKELDRVADKNDGWFYEMEPAVANLNEPGVTRYVRISLTLDVTRAWAQEEAKPFLDQKKPLMKHWLTLYLSNQTIEDMRGEKNLLRMQSNIRDVFNQGLFPNSQARINNVLFKEFAIQ